MQSPMLCSSLNEVITPLTLGRGRPFPIRLVSGLFSIDLHHLITLRRLRQETR